MRIAVTGAGGFVGGALVHRFAAAGHRTLALARRAPSGPLPDGSALHIADLAAVSELPERIDALVHCAAEVPAFCPDPKRLFAGNVSATRAVFRAAVRAGATRIVFCSSMSAYGRISVPMVDETTPPDSPTAYGQSKLEGERLLSELADGTGGVSAMSLRLPGMVGVGARNNFLSGVMAKIAAGASIEASNPDAPFNNVVHVDDLGRFLETWLAATSTGHFQAPLAARDSIPVRDVLAAMVAASGRAIPISFAPTPPKPSFLISTARAEAAGYRPAMTRDSVERFVRESLSVKPLTGGRPCA